MRGVRVGRISVRRFSTALPKTGSEYKRHDHPGTIFNKCGLGCYSNVFESYSPAFEPAYKCLMNSDASTFELCNDLTRYPMTMVIVSARMFEAQLQPFYRLEDQEGFQSDRGLHGCCRFDDGRHQDLSLGALTIPKTQNRRLFFSSAIRRRFRLGQATRSAHHGPSLLRIHR